MVRDWDDFLNKTPKQIDLMSIAYHNRRAMDMYEKQCLHGFKNPKKPILFTNKLADEDSKVLSDKEKVVMETVTNSILQGGKK